MKKLLLMTTIALATMAAAPAPATQTAMAAAQPAASAPQQASDVGPATATMEEKKVCKLLPTSGTRFSKKACLTAKEWKQVEADVQNDGGY
jgi:predicted lipid-binding transport protein (Tim44 family)